MASLRPMFCTTIQILPAIHSPLMAVAPKGGRRSGLADDELEFLEEADLLVLAAAGGGLSCSARREQPEEDTNRGGLSHGCSISSDHGVSVARR